MQEQAKSVVPQRDKVMDTGRMWLWGFLGVIVLSQLYIVRELLAAFALFVLGFIAIAIVVAGLYMLQKSLELAMARLAALRHPVINIATVSTMATVSRENQKVA